MNSDNVHAVYVISKTVAKKKFRIWDSTYVVVVAFPRSEHGEYLLPNWEKDRRRQSPSHGT